MFTFTFNGDDGHQHYHAGRLVARTMSVNLFSPRVSEEDYRWFGAECKTVTENETRTGVDPLRIDKVHG
jgi:hypothetical protein